MKIRKGFVTNSSSSSFILGFTSEENIKKELEAEDLKEYFDEVLEDVMRATIGENMNIRRFEKVS